MATLNHAILTQQGLQLMNEAGTGTNTIQFVKAVTSSDERYAKLTDDQLETLTDLDSIQQSVKPGAPYPAFVFDDNNGNQQYYDSPVQGSVKSKSATTVPMVFPNKGKDVNGQDYEIDNDYLIQAIGLYAHDGNRNQDILYLVITSSNPHLLTAYDGNVGSFKVKEVTAVGRTDKLKIVVGDFDAITEEELNARLVDYVKASEPQNLSNDFNFNGKLQHNGKDVVDSDSLSQALADFNSKDKNAVIDNHDGTVNINGQNLSVTKTFDSSVDANTLTDNGLYHLKPINNNSNVPSSINGYYIAVFNETDGFIMQTAFSADDMSNNAYIRIYRPDRGYWTSWSALATTSYVDSSVSIKTGNIYQNAVNTAKAYAVQDNHDGTITVNGKQFSAYGELGPCDLNDVVSSGFWDSSKTLSSYGNVPNGFNGANGFALLVMTHGSDVYQQFMCSGGPVMYRMKQWGNWNDWSAYASQNYSVKDNNDGTINANGQTFGAYGTLPPGNIDDATTTGFWHSQDVISNYIGTPAGVIGANGFMLIVAKNGNDVYQQFLTAGQQPQYRMKQWGYWTNWQSIASQDYANNAYQGAVNNAYQNSVNTSKGYADQQIHRFGGFMIPTQSSDNKTSNLNGVQAYYNIANSTIYLHGFYNIKDTNEKLQVDVSSIANYLNGYVDLGYTFYNAMTCWNSYPDHVYNNIITFEPNTTGEFSVEGVKMEIKQIADPPIQHIHLNLINANSNEFSLNSAWADYTPSNKTVTLHGSVTANTNVADGDPIFMFNVSDQNMNEITGGWLNSQMMSAQTSYDLKDVNVTSNGGHASGYQWNLEGCTINLDYDGSLKSKIPSWIPSGATQLKEGTDLNNYGVGGSYGGFTMDNNIYYKMPNVNITNSPVDSSYAFMMKISNRSIAAGSQGAVGHGTQWIKASNNTNVYVYYSRDIDVNTGYGFNALTAGWVQRSESDYNSWAN